MSITGNERCHGVFCELRNKCNRHMSTVNFVDYVPYLPNIPYNKNNNSCSYFVPLSKNLNEIAPPPSYQKKEYIQKDRRNDFRQKHYDRPKSYDFKKKEPSLNLSSEL